MNTCYYLYAITRADCPLPPLGPGVDPRFVVQAVPCGPLAALASRVDLERFDLRKLEEGTADLPWLSNVAVRHDRVVREAARCGPLMPLRIGTVFQSRESLLAKITRHETRVVEFLQSLGDRREWTVKVYLDAAGPFAASQAAAVAPLSPEQPSVGGGRGVGGEGGQGTNYLTSRRLESVRRRQLQEAVRRELLAVADTLGALCDTWRQLRPLPANLVDRPQPMVWNAAFLPARAHEDLFRATCRRFQAGLAPKGFALALSGPWPAYHFCPALDSEGEHVAAAPVGR
jgi:hypothetical protein